MGRPKKQTVLEEPIEQQSEPIVQEIKVKKEEPKHSFQIQPERDEYTLNIVDDETFKQDITFLEYKDPAYEYRWLREEHKNLSIKTSNALHQKGGWQLVPKAHLLKLGYDVKHDISPDGFIRRGDCILARMPKDLFERKREVKIKRANSPLDAVKRMIKKGDPKLGGKDIHDSMRGIQTEDALHGNFKER